MIYLELLLLVAGNHMVAWILLVDVLTQPLYHNRLLHKVNF